MEIPTINKLSGTEPSDLLRDYTEALKVVQDAIKVLAGLWPHGRDYQRGDIRTAMSEHADRCKRLRQVAAELSTICEGIINQFTE